MKALNEKQSELLAATLVITLMTGIFISNLSSGYNPYIELLGVTLIGVFTLIVYYGIYHFKTKN